MDDQALLAERFEADRRHLKTMAYRMLGSRAEAEDAVQEAWLRLSRSGAGDIANLRGWLTTVVGRVCLDMLRSRKSRREEVIDERATEQIANEGRGIEEETAVADSVGLALLVVLEALTPAERVAFVLHDMFDLRFEEIAPILGRSVEATRQLASRARRRVQGKADIPPSDRDRRREIVDAFLAASRGGDFMALLSLLDPNVVLRADAATVAASLAAQAKGAPRLEPEIHGAEAVARTFAGRAQAVRPALIDGAPGLLLATDGVPQVAFRFTIVDGKISGIDLIADTERLGRLAIEVR